MGKKDIVLLAALLMLTGCLIWRYVIRDEAEPATNTPIQNIAQIEYKQYNAAENDAKDKDADHSAVSKRKSKKKQSEKVVYLTFDDGPSKCTGKVLDILNENNVPATFFLIGEQITANTIPILKRMKDSGCQIGVHTYSHEASKIYASANSYYDDVMKTEQIIIKKTGIVPLVYRFPWGSNNGYLNGFRKKIVGKLEKAGLQYCDWNVSGEDSVGSPKASAIIANIKSNYNIYNEPVVLLHDSASNTETVKALPKIIRMYKKAGYSFGVISERSSYCQWKLS